MPAVMSAEKTSDGPNRSASIPACRKRVSPHPMSTLMPRVNAAVRSAPIPAKAIWPSDSWPAHPVSTVSERAQMAKPRIVV